MSFINKITYNTSPVIAFSLIFGFIILGTGIYHGTFHTNSRTTHCHIEGVCHKH